MICAVTQARHGAGPGCRRRRWAWVMPLALLGAAAAVAQAPAPPEPDGPRDAGAEGPSEFGEAGAAARGGLDDAGAVLPHGPGAPGAALPGGSTLVGTTVTDEEGTPEFPPGLDAVIAVHPLNPRLDQQAPWRITSDGRVMPRYRETRPPAPVFRAPLADAFSSRREDGAIELAFGGQTSLGGTLGVRVDRLETTPAVIELTVGESLSLDDLAVRAYDPDGEFVPRAPLRLEIEGPEGLVERMAFEGDGRTPRELGTLRAAARGVGRIWVTSLVPASQPGPYSIHFVVNIREPGDRGVHMSSRKYENVPAEP